MESLIQPFDAKAFNFTKVRLENELVFRLARDGSEDGNGDDSDDLLIVNASPVEFGSCLLLPEFKRCLPQVTAEGKK